MKNETLCGVYRASVAKELKALQKEWGIDDEQAEVISEVLNDTYNAGYNDAAKKIATDFLRGESAAENERMRAALPAMPPTWAKDGDDVGRINYTHGVTVGQVRAAREALKSLEGKLGG